MTTIFCSNKLKDFFGKTIRLENYVATHNDLSNWNAHLFYINRMRFLIFVNSKSYYSVVISDFKKADLKNFDKLFLNRFTEQLVYDKVIENSDVLVLLSKLIPFQFSKTNNDKKALGTLNEFIFQIKHICSFENYKDETLLEINNLINNHLTGAGKNSKRAYGVPTEDMKELIEINFKNQI